MGRSKSQRVLLEVVIPTRLSRADFTTVQDLATRNGISPARWVRGLILVAIAEHKSAAGPKKKGRIAP